MYITWRYVSYWSKYKNSVQRSTTLQLHKTAWQQRPGYSQWNGRQLRMLGPRPVTAHQMFSTPSTLRQRNSVTAHFRFHFVFENKLRHGNHMLFRDFIIVFEKPRLQQNVFRRPGWNTKPPFSDSSGLMSVFKKLRFLWWISVVGLTVEIKLRFRISLT